MTHPGHVKGGGLVHDACVYGSPEALVAVLAPPIREGLLRGDPVLVATKRANVEALREELGPDAARIDLNDTSEWYPSPARRLDAVARAAAQVPPGGALRAFGEPVWGDSTGANREWARYESAINVALAATPLAFVCLYDAAALPDDVLELAGRTHPRLVDGTATRRSGSFVDPAGFPDELPPYSPLADAFELPLADAAGLRELRAWVGSRAAGAGVARDAVADLALAASEIATNALRHGRLPVTARLGVAGSDLVLELVDAGPGVGDPLAGWQGPGSAEGGWGVPLARRLCDGVELVAPRDGRPATVALHVALA